MLTTKTCGNLTLAEEKLLHTAIDNLQPLFQAALKASNP
jgi:hypothetical protein